MTTAKTPKFPPDFALPDVPEIPDEMMTAYDHLTEYGGSHFLAQYLGNLETTLVTGQRYISAVPTSERAGMTGLVYPDMLVAFNVDRAAYRARNGYIISEQGKPPDFVLEIGSPSTGRRDTIDKRVIYAELGIPEYWRFDEAGQYHGTRLAGDRLVDGRYEPIQIDELPDGSLQGHSPILNVNLRWVEGQLGWYDPSTGEHVPTMESEREARLREQQARMQEQQARARAEARIQELEEQLGQLRGE